MTQSEFERNRQTYLRMHDNQDILVRSSYTRGDFRKRLDQAIRYLDLARDGVNGNGWPINEERREDFFDLGRDYLFEIRNRVKSLSAERGKPILKATDWGRIGAALRHHRTLAELPIAELPSSFTQPMPRMAFIR